MRHTTLIKYMCRYDHMNIHLRKEKDEYESLLAIEKKEKQELEEQSCKLQVNFI